MLKKSTSAANLASMIFNSTLPQMSSHNQSKLMIQNTTETKTNSRKNDEIMKPRSPHKNSISSFRSLVAA